MSQKLYVENGVGARVVEGFNIFTKNHGWTATVQHAIHPQMQLPQQGDEWWINDATKQGYVILTCDLGIFTTESERKLVERVAARVVGFARANYTAWQMIGGLSFHWTAIEGQLSLDPPSGASGCIPHGPPGRSPSGYRPAERASRACTSSVRSALRPLERATGPPLRGRRAS